MKLGSVNMACRAMLALALLTPLGGLASARAEDAPATTTVPAKPVKAQMVKNPRAPRNLDDHWDRGSTWLSVRAGYAKAGYEGSASGNVGGGFGFTHMFFPSWSLGGYAQYDVLGRFGRATESELPFTLEAARHLKWGEAFHPYVGAGGGTYYHKIYRTGADFSAPRGGGYFLTGFNSPISARGLIGFDLRVGFVNGELGHSNPVFGVEKARSSRWSAKVNWSYAY